MFGWLKTMWLQFQGWRKYRKLARLYKIVESKEDLEILRQLDAVRKQSHEQLDLAYEIMESDKDILRKLADAEDKVEVREALKPLIKRCKQVVIYPLLGDMENLPKKWSE